MPGSWLPPSDVSLCSGGRISPPVPGAGILTDVRHGTPPSKAPTRPDFLSSKLPNHKDQPNPLHYGDDGSNW